MISETGKETHCLLLFSVSSFLTGHTGQRGIGGDGNKFEAIRAALLAAAEADAVAARARLEAAEAEAKSTAKHGRDGEVAAASASSSSSSSSSTSASPSSAQQQQQQQRQQQQRLKSLRKGAERAAADARFPDLPPPPPVVGLWGRSRTCTLPDKSGGVESRDNGHVKQSWGGGGGTKKGDSI